MCPLCNRFKSHNRLYYRKSIRNRAEAMSAPVNYRCTSHIDIGSTLLTSRDQSFVGKIVRIELENKISCSRKNNLFLIRYTMFTNTLRSIYKNID